MKSRFADVENNKEVLNSPLKENEVVSGFKNMWITDIPLKLILKLKERKITFASYARMTILEKAEKDGYL